MTIGEEPTNSQKVQKLQAALHAKAKETPTFRFYALYDKVYRQDVLHVAFRQCRSNDGRPGVDGQTFEQIIDSGVERWLGELAEELRTKQYQPQAVRRVWIPKPDGKQRPLGIPTIKDRVVQTALLLVLEPIFEADLPAEQYAYREGRGALDAVREVHRLACFGHSEVIDADLSGYFDSIPHAELMKCVARRVSDKAVLHLVKLWLDAPVEETDERGHTQRTTRNRDEGRGSPQGAPISPLFANLYMRRFVLGWKQLGHEQRLQAKIVNYADDFVILCRGSAEQAMAAMRDIMGRLKLTVNEAKTRTCKLPAESFDFLSYTIGMYWSWPQRRMVLSTRPSAKAVKRLKAKISETTDRDQTLLDAETIVTRINQMLAGWANYFCRGPVSEAYRTIDLHVRQRIRRWLVAKHKGSGRGINKYPNEYLYEELGLTRLSTWRTNYLRGRNA
jgi:group II intron reverse transcriptase/maturase